MAAALCAAVLRIPILTRQGTRRSAQPPGNCPTTPTYTTCRIALRGVSTPRARDPAASADESWAPRCCAALNSCSSLNERPLGRSEMLRVQQLTSKMSVVWFPTSTEAQAVRRSKNPSQQRNPAQDKLREGKRYERRGQGQQCRFQERRDNRLVQKNRQSDDHWWVEEIDGEGIFG